jgi:hypothetical protein
MDVEAEILSQPLNPEDQIADEFNSENEDDAEHLIILHDQPPILDRPVPLEGLITPQEPRRYNMRHRRTPNPYTFSGKVSEKMF